MTILGIDPGLATTGWGIIEADGRSYALIAFGTIRTEADRIFEDRLYAIVTDILELTDRHKPALIGIEDIFFFKNISSAIPVAKVIGALEYAAFSRNISCRTFSPLQIKTSLTGMGRAEKHQIQEMVRLVLGLEQLPKPDHAADALAAAICCHAQYVARERMRNGSR